MKILAAARAVIDGAIAVLTAAVNVLKYAKRFVEDNTPESALFTALALDYQSVQSGTIPAAAGAIAAFTAIVTFVVTESAKDRAALAAPAPTP